MPETLKLMDLAQRIDFLEAHLKWVQRVLEAYGIRGVWFSPAKAAALLGISRDRIMTEIDNAEEMRALNKRGDLIYGTHYRNIQDPNSENATWQVHVIKFEEMLAIPPDQRKVP